MQFIDYKTCVHWRDVGFDWRDAIDSSYQYFNEYLPQIVWYWWEVYVRLMEVGPCRIRSACEEWVWF